MTEQERKTEFVRAALLDRAVKFTGDLAREYASAIVVGVEAMREWDALAVARSAPTIETAAAQVIAEEIARGLDGGGEGSPAHQRVAEKAASRLRAAGLLRAEWERR